MEHKIKVLVQSVAQAASTLTSPSSLALSPNLNSSASQALAKVC
jgi:hypothetical protein